MPSLGFLALTPRATERFFGSDSKLSRDIKESNQAYQSLIDRLIYTNNCSKENFSIVLESLDFIKESLDQATLTKLLSKIWNHPSVVDYNECFVVGQLLYQKKRLCQMKNT